MALNFPPTANDPMYLSRTPTIARFFYRDLTWHVREIEKSVYLTFDDGPDPRITPEVLSLLEKFNAKATFFCVGEKVLEHKSLYKEILDKGHTTGNHTFNHLNGKKSTKEAYIENVEKAAELIHSGLFRPPYGRITAGQVRMLKTKYKIVMWSVLPGDFDPKLTAQDVLDRAVRHTRKGSIVVFHDNVKFREKTLFALDGFLKHFSDQGYRFKMITEKRI